MLAIVALHGRAGLAKFDAHQDPAVAAFRGKARMQADAKVEAACRGGASAAEMRRVIGVVWGMAGNPRVPVFLP